MEPEYCEVKVCVLLVKYSKQPHQDAIAMVTGCFFIPKSKRKVLSELGPTDNCISSQGGRTVGTNYAQL